MKILFIYAPFTYPVAPPAGIAYLKGFVRDNFPRAKIKCLDLNLEWHNDRLGLGKISLARPENGIVKKEYIKALNRFFKTKGREEKYQKSFGRYLKSGRIDKTISSALKGDLTRIREFRPDVAGFSVQFKSQLSYSLVLAKALKKENENLSIIFGGSLFSSGSLPDANKLLKFGNPVDIIVRGNGEVPLSGILKKYGKDFSDGFSGVPSVTYRDSSLGRIVENSSFGKKKKPREKSFDYRSIPDYADFSLKNYFSPEPVLPLKIAGGCSWGKCTFCQVSLVGPGFYPRPGQRIVEEIRQLKKKFGVSKFHFIASEVPKFLLRDIADNLIKSGLEINYSVYVRPVKSVDDALLKKLRRSGCRLIDYGIESLTQRILDLMDKGTKVEDILDLLKRTKDAGMSTFCWYIVGFPSQTVSEIEKEIQLLEKNFQHIDFFGCHPFYLKESTLVYRDRKLLTPSRKNRPLLLKIGRTKVFDDEELDFKVKKGISQREAKHWADVIGGKFTESKKDGRYHELMKNFREFHILSSI